MAKKRPTLASQPCLLPLAEVGAIVAEARAHGIAAGRAAMHAAITDALATAAMLVVPGCDPLDLLRSIERTLAVATDPDATDPHR